MDTDSLAIELLLRLRSKAEASGDGSIYGDRAEAMRDLDNLLSFPAVAQVKVLLLPTANLQELAIDNGWGEEFNEIAAQLERLLGIA